MKIFSAIVLVVVVLFFGLLYVLATADYRAKFINTESALIEAHCELQVYGVFSNYFHCRPIAIESATYLSGLS